VKPQAENEESMSKPREDSSAEEMLPEYDFSRGMRGKYAKRYAEGSNIVLIAPDLQEAFPTSEAVNEALRGLVARQRKEV